MSVSDQLQRVRMSYEDYLRLPEGVRAEYVDGEAIMTPPATGGHNNAQRRLANLIEGSLDPALLVVTESGVRRGQRVRIPDVSVFARKEDVAFYDQVPILVVEVLSPSTRSEDTVRKVTEYLEAGISQYWLLDRDHATLTVLVNAGDAWQPALELDAEHPRGEVAVGDHGVVAVDLEALVRL